MSYSEQFAIANPSPYERSDYVEVDFSALHVPPGLASHSLKLSRLFPTGEKREVPYQLDYIFGRNVDKTLLTFYSAHTPPASDNYTEPSAHYVLEEGSPDRGLHHTHSDLLHIDYYYLNPTTPEPEDGYSPLWDAGRTAHTVKLRNGNLECAFRLVPHSGPTIDYTGCATSVFLTDAANNGAGEMLCPYGASNTKRWGQLTLLVFFSLPWEVTWFYQIDMKGSAYDLIWANAGPIRGVFTVCSKPFVLTFNGAPYVHTPIAITARLYRIFYVYPSSPYYIEELLVLSDEGASLAFRPYFSSVVIFPQWGTSHFARFEHIPDYFALWRTFSGMHFGYGFAADAHIRGIEMNGDVLSWRIQLAYHKKCIHYFMFSPWQPYVHMQDPYNVIGHYGWYERLYKPMEKIPLFKPYYPTYLQ